MADINVVLPSFSSQAFSNILPSLERSNLTTVDILTKEPLNIARRALIPLREVRRLVDTILMDMHTSINRDKLFCEEEMKSSSLNHCPSVSLLDDGLDHIIGRIHTGYVTEITGESGAGKTQLLYTLLLAAQLPEPRGLGKPSLYITTEGHLQTNRLQQLMECHQVLKRLPPNERPTLSKVFSIECPDMQTQEHILNYQLPVAIRRHGIGLVVIDSITANYRAEAEQQAGRGFAERTLSLLQTGKHLRNLAITQKCVIIVANQVADRFDKHTSVMGMESLFPASQTLQSTAASVDNMDLYIPSFTLDQQQKWFTGWGDMPQHGPYAQTFKTPSLGLVWSNQIDGRIALMKAPSSRKQDGSIQTRRFVKPVFLPWIAGANGNNGSEFIVETKGLTTLEII